jgi:hypothetical protein
MPVILAIWEDEIVRIVLGQPVRELGTIVCGCHTSNCRKLKKIEGSRSQLA